VTGSSEGKRAGAAEQQADPLDFAYVPPRAEHAAASEAAESNMWWLLFEHAPDPILVVDSRGRVVHANAALEKHPAGSLRIDLIGQPFLDLVTRADRPAVSEAWDSAVAQRSPTTIETELQQPEGGGSYVSVSVSPLPEIELFVLTLRDLGQPAPLHQKDQQHIDQLAVLNSLGDVLNQDLDINSQLNAALRLSLDALEIEAGAIMLVDKETQDLVFRAHQGWQQHDFVAQDVRLTPGTGLAGEAVRAGHVIVSDDVAKDPRTALPQLRDEGITTMALAPMRAHNRVVGVFSVMSYQPSEFSQHKQKLLAAIADRVGLALDNTRLSIRIQRRFQERSALHEIAMAAQGILSLQIVMEQGLRALVALFEVDAATIHFLNKQKRLFPIAFQGSATEYWQQLQANPPQLTEFLTGRQATEIRSMIVRDLEAVEEEIAPEIRASGMRTMAIVPLRASGRLIGVLEVGAKRPNALSPDDLPLLESLGAQLATAIESARLHEQTQHRLAELAAMSRVSESLNKTLDLNNTLHIVLDELIILIDYMAGEKKGLIFLIEPNQLQLRFAAARGVPDGETAHYASLTSRATDAGELPVIRPGITFENVMSSSETLELPPIQQAPPSTIFAEGPLIAIPLHVEDRPIGVIFIAGQLGGSDIRRLLLALTDMAAVAIDKAYLYRETERRLDEVSLMHEVTLEAAAALDFDTIISRTLQAIQRRLGFEYVSVMLLDESGQHLHTHSSYAYDHPSDIEFELRVGEGVTGRVAQAGRPILVPDVSLVENYIETIPDVQSELCVPLRVGERVIGVINAESTRSDAFSVDEERLMVIIAGPLAVAMENARLHQETQRGLREMTTLFNFAHHLSTHLQMEDLLHTACTSIRDVLGCRAVSIALLDPQDQTLSIRADAGLTMEARVEARLHIGEGVMGRVAATGESIYVPDVYEIPDYIFFDRGYHSLLTIPLIYQNRIIGTLSADHEQPDAFTPDDERLATIAAAQAAVAIENARLYQDLQDRATSLAQAYEELKEIDRMKDELTQNISHELRTPLTFVRGYVDLLLSGDMGALNARQMQSLEIVSRKTSAVADLVTNIVLLQQLDISPLQLGLTDVERVAKETVTRAQPAAEKQGVSLDLAVVPDLPLVLADPVRVTLVFQHLLENAIKFSPNGGAVRVKVSDEPDCIQVAVSDQGIGISRHQLDRIFGRFYQIDSSAKRRFEGTGLGLTIAKRIVEAHGGRIWAKSRLGKGSVFYFDLPKSLQGQPRDNSKTDAATPEAQSN
jgi:PAS domain S-box-containing protein